VRPEWVGDHIHQVQGGRWDQTNGEVAWSDVNGLPRGWGVTYRCADSRAIGFGGAQTTGPYDPADPFKYTQKGYWFHVPVPTPVLVAGTRSALRRVFVLWTGTGDISVAAVHVWDGAARIDPPLAAGPASHGSPDQLINGVTAFDLPAPHLVKFSIGISFGVWCTQDSDITFHSAGADFEV
jgi:hypothetical protein